jgi:hypothetical protein
MAPAVAAKRKLVVIMALNADTVDSNIFLSIVLFL